MRIAFAEDDKALRGTVARGLREAGYEVDLAANGTQALALLDAHHYDAAILDILMPAPDGLAVCRTVRGRGNDVPILLLTALDDVPQRIAGLDAGADDYVTKPFDFGELLARLRALTRRGTPPASERLVVGDLALDAGRHEAVRAGRTIALSPREWDVLAYLMRHVGRLVTRDALMREVWNESAEQYSNIVDAYVSRLRKKVDGDSAAPMIATVRGAGFILDAPSARPAGRSRQG